MLSHYTVVTTVIPGDEVFLEGEGDGGLSGAAEAGEPDGAAAEPAAHDLAPLRPRDRVLLRVHVRRHRRALKHGRERRALSIVLAFPPIGKSIAGDAECCLLGKFKGGMERTIQLIIPCALPISTELIQFHVFDLFEYNIALRVATVLRHWKALLIYWWTRFIRVLHHIMAKVA